MDIFYYLIQEFSSIVINFYTPKNQMSKVVYFGLQGRAQSIRYLLSYKQVAFEDVRLTFDEWGPIKAAGTYGANASLPVYVDESGKVHNQ